VVTNARGLPLMADAASPSLIARLDLGDRADSCSREASIVVNNKESARAFLSNLDCDLASPCHHLQEQVYQDVKDCSPSPTPSPTTQIVKVFIGGLSPYCTEGKLRQALSAFKEQIEQIRVQQSNGVCRGYAWIMFKGHMAAEAACASIREVSQEMPRYFASLNLGLMQTLVP
jgi:hypothetical protein